VRLPTTCRRPLLFLTALATESAMEQSRSLFPCRLNFSAVAPALAEGGFPARSCGNLPA
jgi:hypothetical protein